MSNRHDRPATLADVREATKSADCSRLSSKIWTTALNSLEHHSGTPLGNIQLDREVIRDVFASVNPMAKGLTAGTWTTVRSRCNTAIKLFLNDSSVSLTKRQALSESWQKVWHHLRTKGEKNTLSSLVHWARAAGIEPQNVNDGVIQRFNASRTDSLRRDLAKYRRGRVRIWNALCERSPELGLTQLRVPHIQYRRKRVRWSELPAEFRDEVSRYLAWAGSSNPFKANARKRALSLQTLRHQQGYLHAAADALVKSGVKICSLRSISDLLEPEKVRTICDVRYEGSGNKHTSYNFELGRVLVQVAKWIGLAEPQMEEIRTIICDQERPPQQMTEKNKKTVRPFENEELRRLLVRLPGVLFAEARNQKDAKRSRLAKLHAALAIGGLTFFPIRLANLVSLRFGEHIELSAGFATVRIPKEQVKNDQPLEFDIPSHYAALLKEYREQLCPQLTGEFHDRVFVDTSGKPKHPQAVRNLVKNYTRRYIGVTINPHAFRHLAAKLILDQNPGAHVVVQHLLGHKNLATTATFYAGIDTKRAGRHHRELLLRRISAPASSDAEDRRPW